MSGNIQKTELKLVKQIQKNSDDVYNVDDSTMIYRYNINGITISEDEPYSSLNRIFKLTKVPQCFLI